MFYLLPYCGNKNLWKVKLVVTKKKHSLIMTFYIFKSRIYKFVLAYFVILWVK